jgi:murein L,D-transpeptidase YcbB/YkuD
MRLIRVAVRLRPLLVVALLAAAPAAAQEPPADPAVALRDLLAAGAPPVTDIDAALGADALSALRAFYATRQDRPFWTETAAAEAGRRLAALKDMIAPGMRPLLQAATARPSDAQGDVQGGAARDLMLSAIYGSVAIDPAAPDRAAGLGPALRALGQASDPVAQLTKTLPAYPGFWRLRTALTAYRAQAAAGGWGNVPDGVKLMRGGGADSDSESEGAGPRVEALRRRLAAGGDLVAAGTGPFDPALESGVVKFQARHGLKTDGIAGARTIEALTAARLGRPLHRGQYRRRQLPARLGWQSCVRTARCGRAAGLADARARRADRQGGVPPVLARADADRR